MNKYYEACKNDYFDYNGVRYYAGTKFTTDHEYEKNVPAYFRGWSSYNPNDCEVTMTVNFGRTQKTIWIPRDEMGKHINEIVEGNYYIEREARTKYLKDSQIPELFFGWIAYIAIMLVLFIFKDRWIGWIAATVYFFWWRNRIKEENTYVEGDY